jgi:hypothetical protein
MRVNVPLLAAAILLSPLQAWAAPSDYIKMPTVNEGEMEVDFKAGSSSKSDTPQASAASIGMGYGIAARWSTEVSLQYKQELNEGTRFDAIEWENKFQLTKPGQYPVTVGFLLEIERPMNHDAGWDVLWGPLFQTGFDKFQFNLNLLFQRTYQGANPGNLVMLYHLQAKYRWLPRFEYGLQGFGNMGTYDNWAPPDQQSHQIGPAVFGKLPVGDHHVIKYNAAWLLSASKTAPDNTLRLQVQYEF